MKKFNSRDRDNENQQNFHMMKDKLSTYFAVILK